MLPDWDIQTSAQLDDLPRIFEKSGFVVLRQALDTNVIKELVRDLTEEFKRLQKIKDSGAELSQETLKHLDRSELPAHPELAPFRLDPKNYRHLTSSKRLVTALETLMGEEYLWHYPTMFREMSSKDQGHLPYHQDYSYNGHYPHVYTAWVPLADCGVDAPGLELVEKNVTEKFKHSSSHLWEFGIHPDEMEKLISTNQLARPALRAGDVIIFNERTLHRTFYTPTMTKSRWSMDARAIPLSAIRDEIWEKRNFVCSRAPTLFEKRKNP